MGNWLYDQRKGWDKKYPPVDIVLLIGPGENNLAQLQTNLYD